MGDMVPMVDRGDRAGGVTQVAGSHTPRLGVSCIGAVQFGVGDGTGRVMHAPQPRLAHAPAKPPRAAEPGDLPP